MIFAINTFTRRAIGRIRDHLRGSDLREPTQGPFASQPMVHAVTDEIIPVGGSGDCSLYGWDGTTFSDTGRTVTAEFPTGRGVEIASGKWVVLAKIGKSYIPIVAEC